MHFVTCRALTETEKNIKMKGDILLKSEMKNSQPIQYLWNDSVTDIKSSTTENNINLLDQDINRSVRDHNKKRHIAPVKLSRHDRSKADINLSTEHNYIIGTENDLNIFDHYLEPSLKSGHESFSDTLLNSEKKRIIPYTWNIKQPDFELTTHYDVTDNNLNLFKYHFRNNDDMNHKEKQFKDDNKDTEPKQVTWHGRKYSYVEPTNKDDYTTRFAETTIHKSFDHNNYINSDPKIKYDLFFESEKKNTDSSLLYTQNSYETGATEQNIYLSELSTSYDSYDDHSQFKKFLSNDDLTLPTPISLLKNLESETNTEQCTETTTAEYLEVSDFEPTIDQCHTTITAENLGLPINDGKILSHERFKSENAEILHVGWNDRRQLDSMLTTHLIYPTKMTESNFNLLKDIPEIDVKQSGLTTIDDYKTGIKENRKSILEQKPEFFHRNEHDKFSDLLFTSENKLNPTKVTWKSRKLPYVDISTEDSGKTKIMKSKLNVFENDRKKLSDVLFKSERKYAKPIKLATHERKQPNAQSSAKLHLETSTTEKMIALEHNLEDAHKRLIDKNYNNNERPIKFRWNSRIHSGAELKAQKNMAQSRNTERNNFLQKSELTVKKDNRKFSPNYLRLKDIISNYDRLSVSHAQESVPSSKTFTDNVFVKMKTQYKQKATQPLTDTVTMVAPKRTTHTYHNNWHHDALYSKMFNMETTENPVPSEMQSTKSKYQHSTRSTMFYAESTENPVPSSDTLAAPISMVQSTKSKYQDSTHSTMFYVESTENPLKKFTVGTTKTSTTSQRVDLSSYQGVLANINAPVTNIIAQETKESIDEATPLEESYKMFFKAVTTTTKNHRSFDYDGNLIEFEEPTFAGTQVTAKQWGQLNSMEERVESIPNYVKETFEDIVKKIAEDVAPGKANKKMKPSVSDNLDKDIKMKRVTNIFQINTETTLPSKRIITITIEGVPKSKMVPDNRLIKYWSNVPTKKAETTSTHLVVDHKDKKLTTLKENDLTISETSVPKSHQKQKIDDLYKEIMRKYETITPFQRKLTSKFDTLYQPHFPKEASARKYHKDTQKEVNAFNLQEENLTKLLQKVNDNSLPQKKHETFLKQQTADSEFNILYIEIMQRHGIMPTNKENALTTENPKRENILEYTNQASPQNIYKDLPQDVSVFNAEKQLTPKAQVTNILSEDANVPQDIFETDTQKKENEANVKHQETSSTNDFNDLYSDFMEKYGNLTSVNTEDLSKTKKFHEKIVKMKNSNWERLKKLFAKKPSQAHFEYTSTEF